MCFFFFFLILLKFDHRICFFLGLPLSAIFPHHQVMILQTSILSLISTYLTSPQIPFKYTYTWEYVKSIYIPLDSHYQSQWHQLLLATQTQCFLINSPWSALVHLHLFSIHCSATSSKNVNVYSYYYYVSAAC